MCTKILESHSKNTFYTTLPYGAYVKPGVREKVNLINRLNLPVDVRRNIVYEYLLTETEPEISIIINGKVYLKSCRTGKISTEPFYKSYNNGI